MSSHKLLLLVLGFGLSFSTATLAQQAAPPSYGLDITIEQAKEVAAGAIAAASAEPFKVAVAVVDNHGFLVYFERMDDSQTAAPMIAIEKARSAAILRRPTSALEAAVAAGRVNVMTLPGALPIAGGVPIIVDGKIIGAVGLSGGASSEADERFGNAGVAALQ